MKKSVLIALLLIAGAAYIGISSLTTPWRYYLTVSELSAATESKGESLFGKRMKIVGTVIPGSIARPTKEDPQSRFLIEDQGKQLRIAYRGPLPEQFQEGRQVVASGKLASAEELIATEVLVKCASKYEEL